MSVFDLSANQYPPGHDLSPPVEMLVQFLRAELFQEASVKQDGVAAAAALQEMTASCSAA